MTISKYLGPTTIELLVATVYFWSAMFGTATPLALNKTLQANNRPLILDISDKDELEYSPVDLIHPTVVRAALHPETQCSQVMQDCAIYFRTIQGDNFDYLALFDRKNIAVMVSRKNKPHSLESAGSKHSFYPRMRHIIFARNETMKSFELVEKLAYESNNGNSIMSQQTDLAVRCNFFPFEGFEWFIMDGAYGYSIGVFENSLCWFRHPFFDQSADEKIPVIGHETSLPPIDSKNLQFYHFMSLGFKVEQSNDNNRRQGQLFLIDTSGQLVLAYYVLTKNTAEFDYKRELFFGWNVKVVENSIIVHQLSAINLAHYLQVDALLFLGTQNLYELTLKDRAKNREIKMIVYGYNARWTTETALVNAQQIRDTLTRDFSLGFVSAMFVYRNEACYTRGIGYADKNVARCAGICCLSRNKKRYTSFTTPAKPRPLDHRVYLNDLLPAKLKDDTWAGEYNVAALTMYDYADHTIVHMAYADTRTWVDAKERYSYYYCKLKHYDANAARAMQSFPESNRHCQRYRFDFPPVDFSLWKSQKNNRSGCPRGVVIAFYGVDYEFVDFGESFIDQNGFNSKLTRSTIRDISIYGIKDKVNFRYHAVHVQDDTFIFFLYANTVVKFAARSDTNDCLNLVLDNGQEHYISSTVLKFDNGDYVVEPNGHYYGNQMIYKENLTIVPPVMGLDRVSNSPLDQAPLLADPLGMENQLVPFWEQDITRPPTLQTSPGTWLPPTQTLPTQPPTTSQTLPKTWPPTTKTPLPSTSECPSDCQPMEPSDEGPSVAVLLILALLALILILLLIYYIFYYRPRKSSKRLKSAMTSHHGNHSSMKSPHGSHGGQKSKKSPHISHGSHKPMKSPHSTYSGRKSVRSDLSGVPSHLKAKSKSPGSKSPASSVGKFRPKKSPNSFSPQFESPSSHRKYPLK